ncbi:hypothetical protein SAMN05428977_101221 [Nitrosomonas sp. Nm166]|nr:hypothetical protein SAMN05428977_101221 [Nitrosomonas sp. Nm166]
MLSCLKDLWNHVDSPGFVHHLWTLSLIIFTHLRETLNNSPQTRVLRAIFGYQVRIRYFLASIVSFFALLPSFLFSGRNLAISAT